VLRAVAIDLGSECFTPSVRMYCGVELLLSRDESSLTAFQILLESPLLCSISSQ
jgi:hypothetical protein